ncbi:uncharacterized protein BCR38DRAFT_449788 [Pseudomassariella vexata]|uniref:Uncharacterized protein n=1 Tax=Pseudomassariella vexata TaxID=1141098 RepID=A0A1Y2DD31_9PEZI|nr:uncharacterized protein BCR38DRAFT_449788 [Pseudomassariella vexata]ORY57159.1 hypothetical protein BCR38DRAFT_449788 [Pseudomassariella vexata]
MCTQVYLRFHGCHCELRYRLDECKHGPASPHCKYIQKAYYVSRRPECHHHAWVQKRRTMYKMLRARLEVFPALPFQPPQATLPLVQPTQPMQPIPSVWDMPWMQDMLSTLNMPSMPSTLDMSSISSMSLMQQPHLPRPPPQQQQQQQQQRRRLDPNDEEFRDLLTRQTEPGNWWD